MSFTRRFIFWCTVVPFLLSVAITVILASQALQLDSAQWTRLWIDAVLCYGLTSAAFAVALLRESGRVSSASNAQALSAALSSALRVASNGSNISATTGSVLFAVFAWATILRDSGSTVVFSAIAVVSAVLSITICYAAAKPVIVAESRRFPEVHYTGDGITLGRKLAVIFIGTFIASTTASMLLMTVRVSRQLKKIAVDESERQFTDVYNIAARMPGPMSEERLRILDGYIDPAYSLYAVLPGGKLLLSQPRLDEKLLRTEVELVARRRDGNSADAVTPHVLRFRSLESGSLLVINVPWDHLRPVPRAVAIYALTIAGTTTLLFAALTLFLARDFTTPLRRIRDFATELASGDLTTEVSVFTDDEIHEVAQSLTVTRSTLRNLMAEVQRNGTGIGRRVNVMTAGSTALIGTASKQSSLTHASVEALEAIRGGAGSALQRTEAVADRAMDATSSASEMAQSASEIAKRMDALFASVEEIVSATQRIGAASAQVERRTETVATSSEDVVSFVAEMDATVEELQRTASATAELSRQVDANAARGAAAVIRTLEGIEVARKTTVDAAAVMRKLAETSQQIAQMLLVIEDVAKRTNLLSLNAAIIAAQAGTSARGFGVIAEEIRSLADETRASASGIATTVHAIQNDARGALEVIETGVARVEESVQLAREAAAALKEIQDSATATLGMSEKTTASLHEQSTSARHLHNVVGNLASSVQEIHAATSEYSRGAVSLGREISHVRDIAQAVNRATSQQSEAARSITISMESVAEDIRATRDHLDTQLRDTERLASASADLLEIARQNDSIATEIGTEIAGLTGDAHDFERAVGRFKV